MSKFKGVDVAIKVDGTVIAGQRGATLNRSGETLDTTTKDSNGWLENEAGMKEWGVDCDGLLIKDDVGFTALETAFNNGDKVTVEVGLPSGNKYSGDAVITDLPIEAPYDDAVSYSASFAGSGPLIITPTT